MEILFWLAIAFTVGTLFVYPVIMAILLTVQKHMGMVKTGTTAI